MLEKHTASVSFFFGLRRNIFWLLVLNTIPTILYQLFDLTWLAIPFSIIGLLGTATAFIITFRNRETYNRTGRRGKYGEQR